MPIVQDPGNIIHFYFPTSNLPFQPPGWGEKCGIVSIGPYYGGAFRYLVLATPSTGGFISQFDFLLVESNMEDGKMVSLAINKAHGLEHDNVLRNWRIYLFNKGGILWFALLVGEDVPEEQMTLWMFSDVQPGTVYTHRVEYSILNQLIRWSVNGQEINSEIPMAPGRPQTTGWLIIGSSQSSNGRNVTYLVDRVSWEEIS